MSGVVGECRRWPETASLTGPAIFLTILILATALRLWGWDYGLPHPTARPDEEITLEAAFQMFASGNPDPVSLPYPSFIVYVDVAALRNATLHIPAEMWSSTFWGHAPAHRLY